MINHIESEVITFLKTKVPEVLVIKGQWGTGKTFAWKKWLQQVSKKNEIELNQYSYVSLFGCSSLDEVKSQIFEELTPSSMIADGVSLETVSYNIKSASEKRNWSQLSGLLGRITKLSGSIPFIRNYSVDIWRLGWLTTKDVLICIDDIERHAQRLDIKDVYGLISVLKEQKNCKVVLILNDQSINDEHKKVYEDYREKVVDIELHFSPETNDLVQLVFQKPDDHYESVNECVAALGIKNIRTIQKIKRYLGAVDPYLKDVAEVYYKNTVNSIVLFTFLYFSKPEGWPDLDMVLEADTGKFAMVEYALSKEEADIQNGAETWAQQMNLLRVNYKWAGADATDQILGALVKQGYLNVELFSEVLKKVAEDTRKIELKDSAQKLHMKVGDILHRTMADNLNELVEAMEKSLELSKKLYPPIGYLNQYVRILRELDENASANDLIAKYISWAKNENSKFLDLDVVEPVLHGPLDKELCSEINKAFSQIRDQEIEEIVAAVDRHAKIQEVVDKCRNSMLSQEDFELLARFEAKDFSDYLRSAEIDREVHNFILIFLTGPGHYVNFKNDYNKIQAQLIEVVKSLADETKLNQFRLQAQLEKIAAIEEQRPDVA